ncbi:hypothetical protein OS493_031981 [Desmophyllum pertusum]|uniref:Protein brambleberry n=1 Tax=Desmophyllum pertusum TaxID=174260 RepID=A0A9W9Z7V2_9CNID|nr:hypothetical protein OS493_031981 [Desmophyllum pertusum]
MAFTEFFWLSFILLSSSVAIDSTKINVGKGADFELVSNDRIQDGKSKLEEFTSNAKSSDCWKTAVEGIEKRCKSLGDIEQSYLAIDFTNCHMSKSGRKIYSCSRGIHSIEQCTGSMDDTTYLAYTTFFAHTANICFYVKSELWQEKTEDTISKLSRTSQDVAVQLEDSAQRQIQVLEKQNVSLQNQKEIISNEIYLSETLRNSTSNAKKAFEDMKQNALEQKAVFTETFDGVFKSVEKVRKLQSMILGEFISLQSVAFYIAAVCTCYFLTSTPRTAAARLPLVIGLFVLVSVERLVTSWGVTDTQSTDTEAIHARLWCCRKLYIIVATIALMVVGYQYQDYNKINFDMLCDMQFQIREMKQWQESQSQQSITHPRYSNYDIPDACIGNNDDDDDDESDHSFVPNESELESFSDESSDEEEHEVTESQKIEPDIKTPVTRRRSKVTPEQTNSASSRRTRSRERAPDSSPSCRYNLRSRRNTPTDLQNGSFLSNLPSPSTIKELIYNVQQRSNRRYTAVIRKPRDNNTDNTSLFSSDEEC